MNTVIFVRAGVRRQHNIQHLTDLHDPVSEAVRRRQHGMAMEKRSLRTQNSDKEGVLAN